MRRASQIQKIPDFGHQPKYFDDEALDWGPSHPYASAKLRKLHVMLPHNLSPSNFGVNSAIAGCARLQAVHKFLNSTTNPHFLFTTWIWSFPRMKQLMEWIKHQSTLQHRESQQLRCGQCNSRVGVGACEMYTIFGSTGLRAPEEYPFSYSVQGSGLNFFL